MSRPVYMLTLRKTITTYSLERRLHICRYHIKLPVHGLLIEHRIVGIRYNVAKFFPILFRALQKYGKIK